MWFFSLESGGSIRDTGKEVFYSGHDKAVEQVAKDYAVKKWGKAVQIEGNMLRRGTAQEIAPERYTYKQKGLER